MNLDSCLLSLSVLADEWWLAYHNSSSTPHAAAPDQRPIGESLISADRHDAYLLPKGVLTGAEWDRQRWMEEYRALLTATPKNNELSGMVEGRSPVDAGQAPGNRGSDRPAEGLLQLERHRTKTLGVGC